MATPRRILQLETLETRDLLSASPLGDLVGVVRDGHDLFLAGDRSSSSAAEVRAFGQPGDRILSGDWNGDGKADLIAVRANAEGGLTWDIDTNGDGKADVQHKYGLAGDLAFVGDWNGDGTLDLGVARRNYQSGGLDWYLDTTRLAYANPQARQFGLVNDTPVVGDWDGNGTTDVGVTRPDLAAGLLQWNLDTSGDAWPEITRHFGLLSTNDVPVTGDWNQDGKTDLGVTRNEAGMKRWYLDTNGDPFADVTQTFGFAKDTPVVGAWKTLAPVVVAPPVVRPPAIPTGSSTPPSHPTLPDSSQVSRTDPFKSYVVVHVTDSNNVSVPGATVTLTSAGGKTLTDTTNERGVVKFPDLPEGTYHATASKDGVGVGVGNIDPKLEPGAGPGYPVVKLAAPRTFASPGSSGTHGRDGYVIYRTEVRVNGDRSWRNNNPGNIVGGAWATRHGAIGKDRGGFAIFPDKATGDRALVSLLKTNYQSLTVAEVITKYAPPKTNDTAAYSAFVQAQTGLAADTKMSTLTDSQLNAVIAAIKRFEGQRAGTIYHATDTNLPDWIKRLLSAT